MLYQYVLGTLILLVDHLQHLFVYHLCRLSRVRLGEGIFVVVIIAHVRQFLAHAVISYHALRHLGSPLQVVHRTSRDMTSEEFLGSPASHERAHLVEKLLLGSQLALLWQIPCSTEGSASWHDAHLHERVGMLAEPRDSSMTSLVQCYGTLLLVSHYLCLLLQSAYYAVHSIEEVLLAHRLAVVASRYQRSLVANVGYVGTRETRRLSCQQVYVEGVVHLQRSEVNIKYRLALWQVWQIHVYLPVETSCPQQSLVEHIHTVGGSKYYDARVGAKAVHLRQESVERVLSLVVAPHAWVLASRPAYGVNLVYEDDRRRLLLSLGEGIPHTRSTHTHEHLHEVRTRHREERHLGLSSHSLGKQRLTRSWRTYEQSSLWYLASQVGIFLGVLQEVHYLLHLLLSTLLTCHVLERDAQRVALLQHLRLRAPHAEDAKPRAASAASAHAVHNHKPQEHEESHRSQRYEEVENTVAGVHLVGKFALELSLASFLLHKLLHLVYAAIHYVEIGIRSRLLERHVEHVPHVLALYIHAQLRLALVHHNARGIAPVHVGFETGVGSRPCRSLTNILAVAGKINHSQRNKYNNVYPTEVELRHLGLVVVAFAQRRYVCVCACHLIQLKIERPHPLPSQGRELKFCVSLPLGRFRGGRPFVIIPRPQ